jgi:hypothetical protein
MKINLFIFRNVILCGTFLVIFGWDSNFFAQTQCPVDPRLVTLPASDDKYYLPENYIFKVKFDAPVSTDTYKTGSIVQFSVAENVLGIKLPAFETEQELADFKQELKNSLDPINSQITAILDSENSDNKKILESSDSGKTKNRLLERSSDERNAKLKKLYAEEVFKIKELFETVRQKFQAKITADNAEAVKTVETKFLDDTNSVKKNFEDEISHISGTDPDKKDKIAALDKRRYEKLEKLAEDRIDKLGKLEADKAGKLEKLKSMPEVVTVIPKDSKGFGKVERAKRQVPLFLNYKARISVVLDYVLLANGDCIPIEVKETLDDRLYDGQYTELGNVIDCKSDGLIGKKCIKGRRPQYKFVSPIITGMAAIAAAFLENDTAQAIVGVTAAEQLNNGDLGNVINGADATISEKLIYEVKTTAGRIGAIKKEEKK